MLLLLIVMMVGMLEMLKLLAECWVSMLQHQLEGLIQLLDQVSFGVCFKYCINITSCLVSTDFSLYSPRCRGSELSLFDCKDYYNRDCSANEGAGVICEYEPPSDTIVELVGGNDTVGNVHIVLQLIFKEVC